MARKKKRQSTEGYPQDIQAVIRMREQLEKRQEQHKFEMLVEKLLDKIESISAKVWAVLLLLSGVIGVFIFRGL